MTPELVYDNLTIFPGLLLGKDAINNKYPDVLHHPRYSSFQEIADKEN